MRLDDRDHMAGKTVSRIVESASSTLLVFFEDGGWIGLKPTESPFETPFIAVIEDGHWLYDHLTADEARNAGLLNAGQHALAKREEAEREREKKARRLEFLKNEQERIAKERRELEIELLGIPADPCPRRNSGQAPGRHPRPAARAEHRQSRP